jgi:hypothetical protein
MEAKATQVWKICQPMEQEEEWRTSFVGGTFAHHIRCVLLFF